MHSTMFMYTRTVYSDREIAYINIFKVGKRQGGMIQHRVRSAQYTRMRNNCSYSVENLIRQSQNAGYIVLVAGFNATNVLIQSKAILV